jgi:hypothetical protein
MSNDIDENQQYWSSVSGIHLYRVGDYVLVKIEIDGKWVEIIRERSQGNHLNTVVGPNGIRAALAKEAGR